MLIYGRNVALEMLKNSEKVQKVLLQKGFDDKKILSLLENSKIPVQIKSKQEIDYLAGGVHQGIILYVRDYQYYTLSDVLSDSPSFIVMLDHIEDPHNFGAIIRTCEAASIKSIIIPKDRSVKVNGTVMKTSVGALENVDICMVTNLVNTIKELKKNGFWIIGTDMEGTNYKDIDYKGKIAIVIGNEGHGLSRLTKDNCDFIAKIPMYGKVNSLNASVAAALVIYEAVMNR